MEKYELDAILEKHFVVEESRPLVPVRKKKRVKFNDQVEVQWPDAAERRRLDAARFIAQRKEERETKLLTLVHQLEGRHRGKSEEDPSHPNFPFPAEYKRIDFEHLDPYKLYEAAEYLRHEQRLFQEPFLLHAKKMITYEMQAEVIHNQEVNRIKALPDPTKASPSSNKSSKRAQSNVINHAFPYYTPSSKNLREAGMVGSVANTSRGRSTVLFAQMNNPGGKVVTVPGYYPKPAVTKIPPRPRDGADALAMKNVAVWLKSNFQIKPVPLILHAPKNSVPGPRPSVISNLPDEPSDFSIDSPPLYGGARELHIFQGFVMGPNVFNDTVGNLFADDYDQTVFKDHPDYTQNWAPHRFRCTFHLREYRDNEISFFFRRPFLTVKAESPRTVRKMGQKAEETLEIPDWVLVDNLKFYRMPDGKIVIEEAGHRKKQPPITAHPEVLRELSRYLPRSISTAVHGRIRI